MARRRLPVSMLKPIPPKVPSLRPILSYSGSSGVGDQGVSNAVDHDPATKWTVLGSPTLTVQIPSSKIYYYIITSGYDSADFPARSPNTWTIAGSNDGSTWTTIDSQSGRTNLLDESPVSFTLAAPSGPWTWLQWSVTSNNGDVYTQIDGIDFYGL